ncbi:MAG: CHASE3 domain-containing protein [Hyphomicrobiaceae bacterium]
MLQRLSRFAERTPEAAAIVVLAIIMVAGFLGARYLQQADWVRHSLEVQTKLSNVWALLLNTEIGQRGYILTGEDRFLQPHAEAVHQLPEELDELADLLVDNAEQTKALADIRTMITERLAVIDKSIAVRRTQSFEAARDLVVEGAGQSLMRGLRERFDDMQRTELMLLDQRIDAAAATVKGFTAAALLAVLATALVLMIWITNSRRQRQRLIETNSALEQTIAARDAAEVQMRQMQKMEAVGQLTGGIAHDFNNMLAVIVSGISLARRRIGSGAIEAADGFLSGALDGANRAATLVQRLLAFSRQQPLKPEATDINKFVANISELIARALGESIRMETVLGAGLWTCSVDPAQLETAILNLCVNARDAMPEGGRLTLETANCHLDDNYAKLHAGVPAGQYVLVAVTDTGTGMSEDVAAKAFEPFFTTKAVGKGTGLGLSQVFGFVKQTNGHIKIYSEPGQGTTVKIYLPRLYGQAAGRRAKAAQGGELVKGSGTILLVEDDANVLHMTASSLRDLGYDVVEARNAAEALEHLQGATHFDLLLTDIVMPDINGRKLADRALALRPDLNVLFMTGFTKNAVVHNGVLDAGVHFLAKPFSVDELASKVREAMDAKVSA